MNLWNTTLILLGVGIITLTTIISLIKHRFGFCSDEYLDKLKLKYGNIDRKKTVKLEILYRHIIGLEYIAIGLFTRKLDIAIIAMILTAITTTLLYYLIRKRYIVL